MYLLAGEYTLAQRRVGNDADTKLFGGIDQAVVFMVGKPRRVLDLEGVDLGNYIYSQLMSSKQIFRICKTYWNKLFGG